MGIAIVYSYFWISKILVNGLPALASLMSALGAKIEKEKDWTEREEQRVQNNRNTKIQRKKHVLKFVIQEDVSFSAIN